MTPVSGNVIDRYLAPAISRFAIDIQTEEKCEPTLDEAEKELRREIVNLHQQWGKVSEESQDDFIRERARGSATDKQGFTRIVIHQQTFQTATNTLTPRSGSTICFREREYCLLVRNSVTSTPKWIRQPEAVWLCVWSLCAWCLRVSMCSDILGSHPLNLRLCLLRHLGFLTLPYASPTCRRRRLNS